MHGMSPLEYRLIYSALLSALFSLAITYFIKAIAIKFSIVDQPQEPRKIHKKSIPLLGGLSVFISFWVCVYIIRNSFRRIGKEELLGLFLGGLVLMIGGYLDDRHRLKPAHQFLFPVLAVIISLAFNVRAEGITNPFGGIIMLPQLLSYVLSGFWLMGMMYTTKLLDGLDGLSSGVTAIGSLTIFMLAFFTKYYQPEMATLALVFFGAILGFLLLNWHPAKIFLGEGGSLWLGFMLGAFAILSGSKIITALLVMGIPILDVGWVILRRVFVENRSPFIGDRKHLHYRLLDAGLSVPQAVLFFYLLSLIFGLSSLFLVSFEKLQALGILFLLMVGAGYVLTHPKSLTK